MEHRALAAFVALIAILVVSDMALNDGEALIFLARKLLDLIALLVFWR